MEWRVLMRQHEFGFAFVHDLPADPAETEKVISHIGPIRHTHCEL